MFMIESNGLAALLKQLCPPTQSFILQELAARAIERGMTAVIKLGEFGSTCLLNVCFDHVYQHDERSLLFIKENFPDDQHLTVAHFEKNIFPDDQGRIEIWFDCEVSADVVLATPKFKRFIRKEGTWQLLFNLGFETIELQIGEITVKVPGWEYPSSVDMAMAAQTPHKVELLCLAHEVPAFNDAWMNRRDYRDVKG